MKYTEIEIELNTEGVEPVTAALSSIGIDSVEVEDPRDAEQLMSGKADYEWDYVEDSYADGMDRTPRMHIYTDDPADVERVRSKVAEVRALASDGAFGDADLGPLTVTAAEKDDADWKDKWKEYFKPTKVSKSIVVKPAWEPYAPAEGEHVIEIDPGMAFGTGTHETTSMCLAMIEKYLRKGMTVLDAGCGSGILSIAAAKLGASKALGIDIDEDAVRTANENIALNGCADTASAAVGDVTKESFGAFDLVAANLMAELLVLIAKGLADSLKAGGVLVASGILIEKDKMVKAALAEAGLREIETERKGEWEALAFEK